MSEVREALRGLSLAKLFKQRKNCGAFELQKIPKSSCRCQSISFKIGCLGLRKLYLDSSTRQNSYISDHIKSHVSLISQTMLQLAQFSLACTLVSCKSQNIIEYLSYIFSIMIICWACTDSYILCTLAVLLYLSFPSLSLQMTKSLVERTYIATWRESSLQAQLWSKAAIK